MNERHVMIDRQQYEQQVAELCEARSNLARLYDPTPITGEWLVACGGEDDGIPLRTQFAFDDFRIEHMVDGNWVCYDEFRDGRNYVRTRGEFRRAAELLGIEINNAANAAEGG